jgi:hypothetical protein
VCACVVLCCAVCAVCAVCALCTLYTLYTLYTFSHFVTRVVILMLGIMVISKKSHNNKSKRLINGGCSYGIVYVG